MRCNGKPKYIWDSTRPAVLGLLVAFAVTVLLIAAFSLVFLALESIYESAVLPLALISAAVGAFLGAYICSSVTKTHGLIYGCAIGVVMFAVIWLIGLFGAESVFGTLTALKAALLICAGAIGGWLGCSKPMCGRWRRR